MGMVRQAIWNSRSHVLDRLARSAQIEESRAEPFLFHGQCEETAAHDRKKSDQPVGKNPGFQGYQGE